MDVICVSYALMNGQYQFKFNEQEKCQEVQFRNFSSRTLGDCYEDISGEDNPQVIITIQVDGVWG